ncbi:hypothetical protein ACFRAQ_34450 [Nocardia sp. NPDC056611]|uniref:hypothetical protein n=1 Tax=Nocardia sp. NPDC056611 TaxID=3345877 RepID=UPI003670F4A6
MGIGPDGRYQFEPMRVPTAPPRFTAWAACPRCDNYTVHRMRPPRSDPALMELYEYTLVSFIGEVQKRSGVIGDESGFEVVRICSECRHEWGMR